jgi:hypothetical protein
MWTLNLDRSKENFVDPIGFKVTYADTEEPKKREKILKK